MASEFKVGDVVVLKSGSPRLTVSGFSETTEENPDRFVFVTWYDGGEFHEQSFDPDCFEIYVS